MNKFFWCLVSFMLGCHAFNKYSLHQQISEYVKCVVQYIKLTSEVTAINTKSLEFIIKSL